MRILYIFLGSLEINTSTSILNMGVVNGLVANGCQVDVITVEADPNHSNYDTTIVDTTIGVTRLKAGHVRQFSGRLRKYEILSRCRRLLGKIIASCRVYDANAVFATRCQEVLLSGKYDVVVSASDPKSSHLFAEKIMKHYGLTMPWVQIWSDPFTDDISRAFFFSRKKVQAEEARLLGGATHVLYISKLLLQNRREKYPGSAAKMHYVPIPYLRESVGETRPGSQDNMLLAYLGDYNSHVRNIAPLYRAVDSSDDLSLIICGSTNVTLRSTKRVEVHPRVSYAKAVGIEKKADVLVHLSNVKGWQVPGKVYQYSGTDKPILFILDGDKERIRHEFGGFNRYHFADNSVEGIRTALARIREKHESPDCAPVEAFSSAAVGESILEILKGR